MIIIQFECLNSKDSTFERRKKEKRSTRWQMQLFMALMTWYI